MPKIISITTTGRGLTDITKQVQQYLSDTQAGTQAGIQAAEGMCHLFIRHTSASLLISENWDQDVQHDLDAFLERLVPDGDALFIHRAEGPDDMPAHVRSALTATTLSIPFAEGKLLLGTWQGIFLWEHRHRGHERELVLHVN